MELISSFVQDNQVSILLGLAALIIIQFVLFLLGRASLARQVARYRALMRTADAKDLDQILVDLGNDLRRLEGALNDADRRLDGVNRRLDQALQRVGVVRFNAYDDTGSDLSFAIALLDAQHNGVVISSLFGRHESRIYAKPIQTGESTYLLSDEEREALRRAKVNADGRNQTQKSVNREEEKGV
ncbi:MAG: DUF4446 family protein [Bacillota bacterium]